MRKPIWKNYAFWIILTEAVGALSALLTMRGTALFNQTAAQPPLSPPAAAFPIVWSLLFAAMGIGAARIWQAPPSRIRGIALALFFLQLAFNFAWSLIFFNLAAYFFALLWLLALWLLIFLMIREFAAVDFAAAALQVPYLLWVSFAAYLNLGVWLLN